MSERYRVPAAGTAEAAVPILFHMVPSRSMIARWMLEELGTAYEVVHLSYETEDQRSAAYRKAINPMGKVPALAHRGVVVTETAAVCAYLADAFPEAELAPKPNDPLRGPYYRWLFFGPSCIEPAVIDRSLEREPGPRRRMGYGTYDVTLDTVAQALEQGPFLVGDDFTAADVIIGSQLAWGMQFGTIDPRHVFEDYVGRLQARPGHVRSRELDAELMDG
jgi:glutathione S-transferase